jgi:hypothetical protein
MAVTNAFSRRDIGDSNDERFQAHDGPQIHDRPHSRIRVQSVQHEPGSHHVQMRFRARNHRSAVRKMSAQPHPRLRQLGGDVLDDLELAGGNAGLDRLGHREVRAQRDRLDTVGPLRSGDERRHVLRSDA